MSIKKPYDGQFFYALTFDPLLLTNKITPYLDAPYYRARRFFYPLVSHLLAFRTPELYPLSLLVVNVMAWISIGVVGYKIGQTLRVNSLLVGFGTMTTTGLTFSVFRTLSEPLALALALWGCLGWTRNKSIQASVFFSLAILTRESFLLIPLCALLHDFLFDSKSLKKLILPSIIIFTPFVIWIAYLHFRLPQAENIDASLISFPFIGMAKDMAIAKQTLTTSTERIRTYSLMFMGLALMLFSFLQFSRKKTFWASQTFFQSIFCSIVHGTIWSYHASSSRAFLPLMTFSLFWLFELSSASSDTIK